MGVVFRAGGPMDGGCSVVSVRSSDGAEQTVRITFLPCFAIFSRSRIAKRTSSTCSSCQGGEHCCYAVHRGGQAQWNPHLLILHGKIGFSMGNLGRKREEGDGDLVEALSHQLPQRVAAPLIIDCPLPS